MNLTDHFKSKHDLKWDFAKQCGVEYGVIRHPEESGIVLMNEKSKLLDTTFRKQELFDIM